MQYPTLALLALLFCACAGGGTITPSGDGGATGPGGGLDGSSGSLDGGSGSGSGGGDAAGPTLDGSNSNPDASPDANGLVGTGGGIDAGPITGLNGKTYYVSASGGSDGNPGTASAPWATIQQAGAVVAPGDTVIVKAGTYDGPIFGWDPQPCPSGDTFCIVAGTATHPILFEADPSAAPGAVIIAGKNAKNPAGFDLEPGCDDVDIVGFTVTNAGTPGNAAGSITKAGIAVGGSTGNRILDNTVDGVSGVGGILVDTVTDVIIAGNTLINTKGTGTTGHGMYVSGSSVHVLVLSNILHDNAYVGLHVNGDVSEGLPGIVTGLLVAGNVVYKNGQNGINCDGIQSSTFENNVIYANARHGIELYQIDALGGSTGNVIVNNTIDQSASAGGYAISINQCQYDNQGSQPTPPGCSTSAADTSTGNIAFNNVLLGGAGVGGAGASSVVSNTDLSLGTNITSASASLFVNASAGDYTLAPGGPGVGTGVASFGGASAPSAGSGSYDTGAFAFAH